MNDSEAYLNKKKALANTLTIYGRKPVLEALQDSTLPIMRLHLAESNQSGSTINEIIQLAETRKIETRFHDRQALSRISKNKKQDQGVALDIKLAGFADFEQTLNSPGIYLALDKVTNPQNLGMIIRTVCASSLKGLILPRKGGARLDPLVIKASAGTVFKANIFWCDSLEQSLQTLSKHGACIIGLDANASKDWNSYPYPKHCVFVLGNETEGLSREVQQCCHDFTKIPMNNGVESLNVAVTAGLLAFTNFKA